MEKTSIYVFFIAAEKQPLNFTQHAKKYLHGSLPLSPQNSASRAQAIKAFLLLQRLLILHPPSERGPLYQPTLGVRSSAEGTSAERSVCDWDFLKTICR